MSSNLSFSNVQSQSNLSSSSNINQSGIQLEGNLIGNLRDNVNQLGADITTLVGGIFGFDKEARQGLVEFANTVVNQDLGENAKMFADTMLSTYNLALDDFGKMSLGDMVGNVIEGAWKHPLTAGLDVATIIGSVYKGVPKKLKDSLEKASDMDVRVRAAEKVTQDNVRLANSGEGFLNAIDDLAKKYPEQTLGEAAEWIETQGVKNVPKRLQPAVTDLLKTNDIYKSLVSQYGAEILKDSDMAVAELISKKSGVAFADIINNQKLKDTNIYKETLKHVLENDVRPLFHLKSYMGSKKVTSSSKITSDILQRKFGGINYNSFGKNITGKAREFVDHLIASKVEKSIDDINKIIDDVNKATGRNVKKLQGSGAISNNILREINNELKKTMLGSFTYLGANVLTTTLNILNNFDLSAFGRTLKKLPKFRMVDIAEAQTPLLNIISRINNSFTRPAVSVDRWLERLGARYIKELGVENAKYLQSITPSLVATSNPLLRLLRDAVPFGRYPAAAMGELGANIVGKPEKVFFYNQIAKIGNELNQEIQQKLVEEGKLKEVDPTKAIRYNEDEDKLIQRSTVVTPIQAANMFLLGEYGDAIQIPVIQFINKVMSGSGDPNVFTVNGKNYRISPDGKIRTNKGEFDLLPALRYAARNMLSPVQFYNQVLVPIMSDKYIKDETAITNKLVNDAQYANMGMMSRRKVKTEAREKLIKRIGGTYEYDYWTDRVSKSAQRQILRQRMIRENLRTLE